jgi:hypothetical protein
MKKHIYILILLISASTLQAQNVETFLDRFKEQPFKLSGGISASQIFYGINGAEARRDPYTYFLSGNLNLSVYGWNIPFSGTYTNQEFQYQTMKLMPFNQYGISPYYKWIKIHAGYRSMNFSSYTLNGRTFYGVGVELTPGIFRFSAMYGKLQNAVVPDTINTQAAYKRLGYGIKAGIGKGSDFIDFIVFAAKDDEHSLDSLTIIDSGVDPMQNLVFNVNASKVLFEKVTLSAEFGSSALSMNTNSGKNIEGVPGFYRATDFLMTNRSSTIYKKAIKSSVMYSEEIYSIGLAYERIDPEYTTLGAYYFNNDFENLTVNSSVKLLKNKLNINANIGGQRNNLEDDKLSGMKRLVTSVNTNYSPSAKWNMSLSYSNFSSYTYIRSEFDAINQTNPYENLDTLNFTQLTQSAGLNTMYAIGDPADKEKRRTLSLNLNYQKASEQQTTQNTIGGSDFCNGNISYIHGIIPQTLTITTSLAANLSTIADTKSYTLGPTVSIGKAFFEKTLKSTFSASFNQSFLNGNSQSRIFSFRLNGAYSIKKKHNLGLSMIVLNRNLQQEENPGSFTEFTGTLNYSYNFSILK